MKPPRGLTAEEAALWRKVAATVVPLNPPRNGEGNRGAASSVVEGAQPKAKSITPGPLRQPPPARRLPPPRAGEVSVAPAAPRGLDSHWDRRLRAGTEAPDFSLDLHGLTLDQAHARLEDGLDQARAMGARLVLVVAGKPRPADAADRGHKRGAIRAKLLDWLAAGRHADAVAGIRQAHRRHGGEGALYLVLRRR